MKRKIAVYLEEQEYQDLQQIVSSSNMTITAYCKNKIFNSKKEEDFLKKHILRQFEDLLYLLISQYDISKTPINEKTIKEISSYAIYVGNLKAKNNKKLKFQRQIEFDYKSLFKLVNIKNINSLITQVNNEESSKKKIILLASYIKQIRNILKVSNEKV
ncbi:hypothetical protein [Halarcobacter sp.]|uniref:hypothetical protein n=1 Tax=Halarcobacter sp. TaxID=2321133 RepID=UPI003A8E8E01